MNEPVITVILATHNGAQYVEAQLNSILQQSYPHIEILIQDDVSTDETLNILNRYSKTEKNITIHANQINLGIAANFLSLISRATGDYIAICDQDDVWHEDKLKKLLANIGNASLIYTDSILIDAQGKELGGTLLSRLKLPPKQGKHLDLFEQNSLSGHSCLFSKDLKPMILHCSEFWLSKDLVYDMVLGIAASWSMGVKFHNTPLTYHRLHGDNNQNQLLNTGSRHKKSYLLRRIARVQEKVEKHLYLLAITEKLFTSHRQDIPDIFNKYKPLERFPNSFYQRRFHLALQTAELPKNLTVKLSMGKWYYILFKWL